VGGVYREVVGSAEVVDYGVGDVFVGSCDEAKRLRGYWLACDLRRTPQIFVHLVHRSKGIHDLSDGCRRRLRAILK
jgi:hypothetical protein